MDISDLKIWVANLICEEINKDQLIAVSKSTGLDEKKIVDWLARIDLTPNQSFSVWLLRGLRKGWIRFEDEQRIIAAINRFIQLRNANRIEDIMNFPHINDLELRIDQLTGQGSNRQGFSGVDPRSLPGVSVIEERPEQHMTFFKVTDADSLAKMGEGTKWCTRSSYGDKNRLANNYIKQCGYLIIIFKDNKPFIQYNPGLDQIMDVNDRAIPQQSLEKLKFPPTDNDLRQINPAEWVMGKINHAKIYNSEITEEEIEYFIPALKNVTESKYNIIIPALVAHFVNVKKQPSPAFEQLILRTNITLLSEDSLKKVGKYVKIFKAGEWPEFDKRYLSIGIKSIIGVNDRWQLETAIRQVAEWLIETDVVSPDFESAILGKNFAISMGYGPKIRSLRGDDDRTDWLPGNLFIEKYANVFGRNQFFKQYKENVKKILQSPGRRGDYIKDEEFEKRIVNTIKNGDHYFHLKPVIDTFVAYAIKKGIRSKLFEDAIVAKDFTYALTQCPRSRQRAVIPGMWSLCSYVTKVIGGHWPEFERKFDNNIPNSIVYYTTTGLSPTYITNQYIKDIILFSKFIKEKDPKIRTDEFEYAIRDFIIRARGDLKRSSFSPVIHKVLIPYLIKTKKSLKDVVGPKLARRLMKSSIDLANREGWNLKQGTHFYSTDDDI